MCKTMAALLALLTVGAAASCGDAGSADAAETAGSGDSAQAVTEVEDPAAVYGLHSEDFGGAEFKFYVTGSNADCGAAWESFEKVLPVTDLFLYDIKHIDPEAHKKLTGADNSLILENLRRLSDAGAAIEIRMPLVPQSNDDEGTLHGIGAFLKDLNITRMKVLPYHSMARSKYAALGMRDTMPDVPSPSDDELSAAVNILKSYGINAVSGRE